MRCLALLLALVMVFTVLPVTVLADEPAQQIYKRVTTAPEDWSGTYLIVYEAGKKAFDGNLANLDTLNTFDVTPDNGAINSDYESKAFTVAKSGDAYTIQGGPSIYIKRIIQTE